MRIRFAILSSAVVAWAMGSVAVQAFEQSPLAPVPEAQITVPAQPQPDLLFDSEIKEAEPGKKGRSFKLPGIGKLSLPRFNFGLDLMYGTPETDDTDLSFSSEPASDEDMTIMGNIKRRF